MNVDDPRPLSGVKVADLSWVVAGPSMTRVLADFGATVVRVESRERPDTARVMQPFHGGEFGIEASALYGTCNAGKFDLGVDLSHQEGRAVVHDLAMWADVLVESFSPGTLAKWGLSSDSLVEANPGLIVVSSSLMGQSGPLSSLAGFGNIGASVSGFQALVGYPDELPTGPYGPYTDYVAPKLALTAVLAALIRRGRTEEGCIIDVSQVEAGLFFLSPQLAAFAAGQEPARARGNRGEPMAPHGVYRCTNVGELDRFVAIAIETDEHWAELARAMGREDLAEDETLAHVPGRVAAQERIDEVIEDWTRSREAEDIESDLQGRGVPAHVATSCVDYPGDGAIRARGHLVNLDHPLFGTTTVEGPKFMMSQTPGSPQRPAPRIGEHSRYVLSEFLGYSSERIEQLLNVGAVQSEVPVE